MGPYAIIYIALFRYILPYRHKLHEIPVNIFRAIFHMLLAFSTFARMQDCIKLRAWQLQLFQRENGEKAIRVIFKEVTF